MRNMTSDPVIRFTDVSKTFRRPDGRGDFIAVDKLSFEIAKGEIVAVLGKTGCGKSTMFNIVAGLTEPSSGEARVIGHEPFREFDFFRGKIGIVFQNDRLMPWRSALDNVRLGLQILDSDPKQAEETARRLAGAARPLRPRERLSARIVGWHAPARVDRARLRGRPGNTFVRRAVLLAR